MKKNLKKVISAVLALTLAMSSFVAMTTSAATFADVADTANYAEAVNALAALGAISGYEDGTFLPDNNITRAEVTTMVVAALNMSADAQASGATTKFADVNEKAKWAAGYVNVGVANGWISGMSATEFAPSDNVTYAQVLSMLTRILGYGDYAVSKGGWPDGYLAAASSAGILSGVSAAANDAMTRAQVARLIWNAVQAPMLEVTTFGVDAMNSTMTKLDGGEKANGVFKTVLSDKFEAYVFPNVQINPGSEKDEVKLTQLVKAPWNPEAGNNEFDKENPEELTNVKVGKTDAKDYLFTSAKVVVTFVDDEWELVYFAPTTRNATVAIDGSLADSITGGKLVVNKSASSTSKKNYELDSAAKLYINGKDIATISDSNKADVLVAIQKAVGDVVLYEKDGTNTYDKVMVNAYGIAKVNQVSEKSGDVTVKLTAVEWPLKGKFATEYPATTGLVAVENFEVKADDVEEGDVVVSVTKNGTAADLTSLAKGDIIAVKFDVTAGIEDSENIEILATTDKVTGTFTYIDDEENLYEIGGAMYMCGKTGLGDSLTRGNTYTFSLDPFGRLYSIDDDVTVSNFAILEKYSKSANTEYNYVEVVTLDGQVKRLYIEPKSSAETDALAIAEDLGTVSGEGYLILTGSDVAIEDRIIEYKVKSNTGRVNKIEIVPAAEIVVDEGKYTSMTNKLLKPLASSVTVLDATEYVKDPKTTNYKAMALSSVSESVDYTAIVFGKNTRNEYAYVILKSAGAIYGPTSGFAVAAEDSNADNMVLDNDEEVYTLRAMMNGNNKAEKLLIADTAVVGAKIDGSYDEVDYDDYEIAAGSAFLYTTNALGYVDRIDVILEGEEDFADYLSAVYYTPNPADDKALIKPEDWWTFVDDTDSDPENDLIQIFVAPVIYATETSVTFADFAEDDNEDDYIDLESSYDFGVAADAEIYAYDTDSTAKYSYNKFSGGAFAGIDVSLSVDGEKAYIVDVEVDDDEEAPHNFAGEYQLAFVVAVDGIVTRALIVE